MISIIIPVFNEESCIGERLDLLSAQQGEYELIVVDGGSGDRTIEIASACLKARVVTASKGRGSQMNAGARLACGEWLFFLHADTCIEPHAIETLARLGKDPSLQAGCFRHRFDSRHPWLWIVSAIHNLRFLFTRIIYGDQCLFVRRELFFRLGGFKEIVMEDIEFSERLLRAARPVQLPLKAVTSARKFYALGVFRATFRVLALMHGYGRRKGLERDLFFSDIR